MRLPKLISTLKKKEKTIFTFPLQNISMSGADLFYYVYNIADSLKKINFLNRQNRVAILYENSVEYVILFFVLILRKLVIVPINPSLSALEIKKIFLQSKSELLIVGNENRNKVKQIKKKVFYNFSNKNKKYQSLKVDLKEIKPEKNKILLLYTSGSTGAPKGSPITETNILYMCKVISDHYKLNNKTKTLVLMPMFHNNGLIGSFLSTLISGGSTTIAPANFIIYKFWFFIKKYKISYLSLMPSVLSMIKNYSKYFKNNSLKIIACGGQKCSSNLIKKFETKYNLQVNEQYGLTETTSIATAQPLSNRNLNSVGKVLKGTSIKLLKTNNVLTSKGPGEICIKGKNVISGYFENKSLNKKKFFKGFLRTGDYGYFDKHKNLFFTSRKDFLIIKGGENIYPAEVENALYGLKQVDECAVVGYSDKFWGQDVYAFVKTKKHNKDLQNIILKKLSKFLAKFKIPKKIFFLGVDTKINEFPKTPSKKIIYSKLLKILKYEIFKK